MPTLPSDRATLLLGRAIPHDASWDVIVVGGGPAGCAAAAAAAREGAKTLILEQTQALGGSGTTALVPSWCPFSDKEKIIYRGLAEQVFTAALAAVPHVRPGQLDWVPINAEHLKRVYDDLLAAHGARVRFQTFLTGVEHDGAGGITALLVANKHGLQALSARVYIDCTGDGDLAAWAGADFHQGSSSGEVQPATHCFQLAGVNEAALANASPLHGGNPKCVIHRILASGKYPEIPDSHFCVAKSAPGVFGFNAGHLFHVDNTDPDSVSKAAAQGRKLASAYQRALAEFEPEVFGKASLVSTGAQVGIRETRRIVGDYTLTLEDWLARRTFPDEICRNAYFIDLHFTAEEARKKQNVDVEARFQHYAAGESHGIPYRCLTPKGIRNLLVAGRNISCDHPAHGSIRVMPVCLAMGEAAGVAAALAAADAGDTHAVDTRRLRERLRACGAYLPVSEGTEVQGESRDALLGDMFPAGR
ncbi:MAG: FAD-dependent oxidoreductase [Opitutaceae bacterium]|nr:FAD-dependent oxidoreductase [Opitutaceae bacterium]